MTLQSFDLQSFQSFPHVCSNVSDDRSITLAYIHSSNFSISCTSINVTIGSCVYVLPLSLLSYISTDSSNNSFIVFNADRNIVYTLLRVLCCIMVSIVDVMDLAICCGLRLAASCSDERLILALWSDKGDECVVLCYC